MNRKLVDPPAQTRIPTDDEIDEVLVRLFFSDNAAWIAMIGLRADRDQWKRGLQGIE